MMGRSICFTTPLFIRIVLLTLFKKLAAHLFPSRYGCIYTLKTDIDETISRQSLVTYVWTGVVLFMLCSQNKQTSDSTYLKFICLILFPLEVKH
jgi:hypothetical protein